MLFRNAKIHWRSPLIFKPIMVWNHQCSKHTHKLFSITKVLRAVFIDRSLTITKKVMGCQSMVLFRKLSVLRMSYDIVLCNVHNNDVIMTAMASQSTSLTIVYWTVYLGRSKKTSKLRVTGLCVGNSPGTGEFPAQMANNAENVSIWWRHHGFVSHHGHSIVTIVVADGLMLTITYAYVTSSATIIMTYAEPCISAVPRCIL